MISFKKPNKLKNRIIFKTIILLYLDRNKTKRLLNFSSDKVKFYKKRK